MISLADLYYICKHSTVLSEFSQIEQVYLSAVNNANILNTLSSTPFYSQTFSVCHSIPLLKREKKFDLVKFCLYFYLRITLPD
jgi:hypothetical protein